MNGLRTLAATAIVAATAGLATAGERLVPVAAGETLGVLDTGAGEAVLLIPGLVGSAFGYRKLTALLAARGYRAIVVEPLGVGASSRPRHADYSLTAQADRLAAALDALGVEQATVVAHAVGGSMALRLALRHPRRVRAIVSVDGGPAEAAATPALRRAMRFSFLLRLLGGGERIRRAVRSTLLERAADPRWVTDEVVEGYVAGAARDVSATLGAYARMAQAREPQALAPRLAEIRCPVRLVLGAARRPTISDAEIRLLAASLPAFAIHRVPGAGSFVHEEDPEAVTEVVAEVVAAAGAAAPRGSAVLTGGLP